MSTTLRQSTGREGFVLVAVLGVIGLMSGMLIAVLLLSRGSVDTAAIATADIRMDSMARSAVALAGYQLYGLDRSASRIDGQELRLNDGSIVLDVSSESGKVDLNGANRDILAAAYKASGLNSLTPQSFAARVADWRDPDNDVTPDGAEADQYAAAGAGSEPRNAPFRSVDDLRWVLGVSAADIDVLRPLLTIYNPRGRLDVFSTPGPIVAALPGVGAETAAQVLALRESRDDDVVARLEDLLLVQAALIDARVPRTYRIRIAINPASGGKTKKIEVVLTTGVERSSLFHVLDWNEED